jgi:hypothetical protein
VHQIASNLAEQLFSKEMLSVTQSKAQVCTKIEQMITDELLIEDRLNDEVRDLLKAYESQIEKGQVDYVNWPRNGESSCNMLLSEEKVSHLAHRILDGLSEELDLAWRVEEGEVLREIKRVITLELKLEEEIDFLVRQRLASYSRPIAEGSPEWEVLYRKFFNEEMRKKKKS